VSWGAHEQSSDAAATVRADNHQVSLEVGGKLGDLLARGALARRRRKNMTPVQYELDRLHTTIAFSVRHMMVTRQRGQFHDVRGILTLDRGDPSRSSVEAASTLHRSTLTSRIATHICAAPISSMPTIIRKCASFLAA